MLPNRVDCPSIYSVVKEYLALWKASPFVVLPRWLVPLLVVHLFGARSSASKASILNGPLPGGLTQKPMP